MAAARPVSGKPETLHSAASFAGNVAVLAGGAALGQLLTILASPVLSRIYSPADFGVLAVYLSILGLVAAAAALRYEFAIPLAEDDATAAGLLAVCLCIVCLVSCLAGVCVWRCGNMFVGTGDLAALSPYLWLLPLGVLALGLYNTLTYWLVRNKNFRHLALAKLTTAAVGIVVQSVLGLLSFKPVGLLWGWLSGQGMGVVTLAILGCRDGRTHLGGVTGTAMRRAACRYRQFPIFSGPTALFNALSRQLPVLMLGYFFSSSVVGYWLLSNRLLGAPTALVATAIGQVFLQRAARHRNADIAALSLRVFRCLVAVGLAPILLLTISAPELFSAILGAHWRQAGVYAQWLAPWQFFVFVGLPLSNIFNVLERLREAFLFNLCILLARFAALYVGGVKDEPMLGVALFGVSGAVLWLIMCLRVLSLAGASVGNVGGTLYRELLAAIPFAALVWGVKVVLGNDAAVAASTAACVLVFFVLRNRQLLSHLRAQVC